MGMKIAHHAQPAAASSDACQQQVDDQFMHDVSHSAAPCYAEASDVGDAFSMTLCTALS